MVYACPPEDVGGYPGYAEFLAALEDPTHEEHRNMLPWIGGSFDPTAFDLAEVNERLSASRPMSGMLGTGLRIEVQPDDVAGFRHVATNDS